MGTSEEQRLEEPDGLELEAETVKDLDVSARDEQSVRGGNSALAGGSRVPGASK